MGVIGYFWVIVVVCKNNNVVFCYGCKICLMEFVVCDEVWEWVIGKVIKGIEGKFL